MDRQVFYLGEVLSVTTGHLVSNRGIISVYKVIDFVLGPNYGVMTHEIPTAMPKARTKIQEQHPDLAHVVFPELQIKTEKQLWGWLEQMEREYGSTVELTRPSLTDLAEKDVDELGPVDHDNEQFNRDAYEL
jgi:hypothetical protein